MLTADSTGSGEKTTAGKKGILCRIKSIQICIIFFWASLGLETCFWHLKPQNLTFQPFAEQVAGPSSNIRPGMPSSHPSDISLASGPGDKWSDKVPWRCTKHNRNFYEWIEGPFFTAGWGAIQHCWQLSQQIPSYNILYILYLSILSKSPNPVLESSIAREYPKTRPSPVLQVLDQCRVAFPKSSAIFSHHPVPFLGEMNTRQSTIKQLLHWEQKWVQKACFVWFDDMFPLAGFWVQHGAAGWAHILLQVGFPAAESRRRVRRHDRRASETSSAPWAHGEFGYILRMIRSNME